MINGELPFKTWFRCTVCNDVHYGMVAPEICPTCRNINSFVQVPEIEAEVTGGIVSDHEMIREVSFRTAKDELRELFTEFSEGKEYELNTDEAFLDLVLDGILRNEKDTGLKYCPCRLRNNDILRDLMYLCPCNFTVQDTYINDGRCWCGLFTKKKQ